MKPVRVLLVLAICYLWAAPSRAQRPHAVAESHILQLKEGVLIVVLPTRHKKIAELERLLASDELSDKSRRRLGRMLADTRASVASLQQALRNAFRDAYRFSAVAFAYDHEAVRLKPAELALTDVSGAPFALPPGRPVYFAMLGRTDPQTGSSMEALLIADAQREVLQRPFPYYQRRYPPAAILDALIGAPGAEERHTRKMVARLNRKLFRYHQEVLEAIRQAEAYSQQR